MSLPKLTGIYLCIKHTSGMYGVRLVCSNKDPSHGDSLGPVVGKFPFQENRVVDTKKVLSPARSYRISKDPYNIYLMKMVPLETYP